MAGIWGLLAVPLSNPQAAFSVQLLGTLVIFGWVFGASLAVWYILRITLGIRVSKMEELHGVDVAETGVPAYPEFVPVIPATAISQPVRV
jgi:Amt family ammonium transporter